MNIVWSWYFKTYHLER